MNRTIVLASTALSLALAAAPAPARAEDPARTIAVVVDRDNPRQDITVAELREIFQGKRKDWPDGARIIALDLEPGPAREGFNRAVLKMDQAAVDQYWVEQKVRGTGTPPKAVGPATAVKLVPRVRGAIAYVPLSAVDASVKVLTVEGVAPDKAGYPLVAR
jgi:ABC-type phosphate transport system substrate-binding protein